MARHNRTAGRPQHLQEAVELLDRAGNPFADPPGAEAWLELQARRSGERYPPSGYWRGRLHLWRLDPPMRLALEMAAHEETERLYLASHLSVLEAAWREAEEVARIADDLLVPDWISGTGWAERFPPINRGAGVGERSGPHQPQHAEREHRHATHLRRS